MNFKRKLLIFLISFSIIIPQNVFAYSKYLILGGENIGIRINSNGVFVVGFYHIDGKDTSKTSGLKIGDRIVSVNDTIIENINDLLNNFNFQSDVIHVQFGYIRNNKLNYTTMELKKDQNGGYKTGIYVKDSITGIGTLTYIDPNYNDNLNNTKEYKYGALGHEVIETNSGNNFTLSEGDIYSSKVVGVIKSSIGNPGEKNAKINNQDAIGTIDYNIETGIFGKIEKEIVNEEMMEVGSLDDVKIGKAEIVTVLEDDKKERFEVEILSIDKKNATKNFLIEITDKKLLAKTGGIIKGMSGSPIIQNEKIIGAITHTIVDNPKKGYGISITKMLESVE